MTEKMTAHLYLSSESFKYNGTDYDDAIKNKLVLFYDLVKTLVANKNENKLFVFHTAFLNSPIFSDGTTVMEIIQNQPESYNKEKMLSLSYVAYLNTLITNTQHLRI